MSIFTGEKNMKRLFSAACLVMLASVVVFAYAAQPIQDGEMMKKSEKKSTKKKEIPPTGDADIQKCITDKLASSEKLKPQGFSATVNAGVATLTGNAANPGSKGAATNIAKRCGAKSVTNTITVPAGSGPPRKKVEKK
jgi:osmotically-inducible protein OsmY